MVGRTMTSSDHRLWFPASGSPATPTRRKPFQLWLKPAATCPRWLGAGEAGSAAEAVGPAEVEAIVAPAITADEAAERMVAFRSARSLALAGR